MSVSQQGQPLFCVPLTFVVTISKKGSPISASFWMSVDSGIDDRRFCSVVGACKYLFSVTCRICTLCNGGGANCINAPPVHFISIKTTSLDRTCLLLNFYLAAARSAGLFFVTCSSLFAGLGNFECSFSPPSTCNCPWRRCSWSLQNLIFLFWTFRHFYRRNLKIDSFLVSAWLNLLGVSDSCWTDFG